jgi:hypothetical protein
MPTAIPPKRKHIVGRVLFRKHQDLIFRELAAGWSLWAIYQRHQSLLEGISYRQLGRHVASAQQRPAPAQAIVRRTSAVTTPPPPQPIAPLNEGSATHVRNTRTSRGFSFDPSPREDDKKRFWGITTADDE